MATFFCRTHQVMCQDTAPGPYSSHSSVNTNGVMDSLSNHRGCDVVHLEALDIRKMMCKDLPRDIQSLEQDINVLRMSAGEQLQAKADATQASMNTVRQEVAAMFSAIRAALDTKEREVYAQIEAVYGSTECADITAGVSSAICNSAAALSRGHMLVAGGWAREPKASAVYGACAIHKEAERVRALRAAADRVLSEDYSVVLVNPQKKILKKIKKIDVDLKSNCDKKKKAKKEGGKKKDKKKKALKKEMKKRKKEAATEGYPTFKSFSSSSSSSSSSSDDDDSDPLAFIWESDNDDDYSYNTYNTPSHTSKKKKHGSKKKRCAKKCSSPDPLAFIFESSSSSSSSAASASSSSSSSSSVEYPISFTTNVGNGYGRKKEEEEEEESSGYTNIYPTL